MGITARLCSLSGTSGRPLGRIWGIGRLWPTFSLGSAFRWLKRPFCCGGRSGTLDPRLDFNPRLPYTGVVGVGSPQEGGPGMATLFLALIVAVGLVMSVALDTALNGRS